MGTYPERLEEVDQVERPVRRRVALKIIKLGMDTKQVIAYPAACRLVW